MGIRGMRRALARVERPPDWRGAPKKHFLGVPGAGKDARGTALGLAQLGGKYPSGKPWKGQGPGVFELVEDFDGDAYRAVYPVRFKEVVYVLHAFQKKSPNGIKTAQVAVDLIERRFKVP